MATTQMYRTLEQALASIMREDKEYIFVHHTLEKDEQIEEHYHPNVSEYLLLQEGTVELKVNNESSTLDFKCDIVLAYIPKMARHSLRALTPADYLVLREGPDESVFAHKDKP